MATVCRLTMSWSFRLPAFRDGAHTVTGTNCVVIRPQNWFPTGPRPSQPQGSPAYPWPPPSVAWLASDRGSLKRKANNRSNENLPSILSLNTSSRPMRRTSVTPFVCFLFFWFCFLFVLCWMWDLNSLARDRTRNPFQGQHTLNHWTARKGPSHMVSFHSLTPLGRKLLSSCFRPEDLRLRGGILCPRLISLALPPLPLTI